VLPKVGIFHCYLELIYLILGATAGGFWDQFPRVVVKSFATVTGEFECN